MASLSLLVDLGSCFTVKFGQVKRREACANKTVVDVKGYGRMPTVAAAISAVPACDLSCVESDGCMLHWLVVFDRKSWKFLPLLSDQTGQQIFKEKRNATPCSLW